MVGVVYGQGAPTPATEFADKLVAMLPGNILLEDTAPPPVLKQLTWLTWWWLVETTELSGLTGHGKVLVPSGEGTLVAQLLYE